VGVGVGLVVVVFLFPDPFTVGVKDSARIRSASKLRPVAEGMTATARAIAAPPQASPLKARFPSFMCVGVLDGKIA
jgi:hypothetical protein